MNDLASKILAVDDSNITRRTLLKTAVALGIASLVLPGKSAWAADKADKGKTFRIAWSHYTGWEPWEYARQSGILKKWADKFGIKVDLELINDYMESINLYTSGVYHGVAVTNMDVLTNSATGGVDSTALIVGDFSNDNDGIVIKNGSKVTDLKGREVKLVQLSVSQYLLSRALMINGMSEKDVVLVNTSDSDIATVFANDGNGIVVTWNPPLMQCRNIKGATMVFGSSQIPGEIIDLMVVRTDAPDSLKKALVGAWYEVLSVMQKHDQDGKKAKQYMAKFSGATEAEFEAQLKTTAMFYKAKEAAEFTKNEKLKQTMEYVRTFSFEHGLYGQGAKSKDEVGIMFPDGTVMGSKKNIKLRFDATFMQMAADGK